MRHYYIISVAIVFAMAYSAHTKKFSRCELAKELKNSGISDVRNCEYFHILNRWNYEVILHNDVQLFITNDNRYGGG